MPFASTADPGPLCADGIRTSAMSQRRNRWFMDETLRLKLPKGEHQNSTAIVLDSFASHEHRRDYSFAPSRALSLVIVVLRKLKNRSREGAKYAKKIE